jgi:FtsH-binding integral membrane protein
MAINQYSAISTCYLLMSSLMLLSLSVSYFLTTYLTINLIVFLFFVCYVLQHQTLEKIGLFSSYAVLIGLLSTIFSILNISISMYSSGLVPLTIASFSFMLLFISKFIRITRNRYPVLYSYIISGVLLIYFTPIILGILSHSVLLSALSISVSLIFTAFITYKISEYSDCHEKLNPYNICAKVFNLF